MLFRLKPRQNLTVLAVSAASVLGGGHWDRAIAHQVQTSTDVGGTVHIEPNDTPRAGEPAVAWFALTQRGGVSVPLSDCGCELTVYSGSGGGEAIATPELTPLSTEGYDNIPSATVTFPRVGQYELVITGSPTTDGAFQPFELRFPVTVATVAPAAAEASPAPDEAPLETASAPAENQDSPAVGMAIALVPAVIIALGLGWILLRRAKPSKDEDSTL